MADVKYDDASRIYPGSPPVRAVDSLNLDIPDGEFLVLVGPSGSGKSTALRMLAGLEDINEGRVIIGGRDVTNVPPKNRDIAMVFQSYALYPHMTVAENMGFALKIAGRSKRDIDAAVRRAAESLQLEPLPNLDASLRTQMRLEMARLHERLGATIVYVTHDQVEAMTLGDRIAVFNAGRIEQVGAPTAVYRQPVNRFVAGFLGSPQMNFLPA